LTDQDTSREYVSIDQIPSSLQNAFIATEDKNFFEHNGIDLYDLTNGTLTTQLLKNQFFASSENDTFTARLTNTIQQLYLSLAFERKYDKRQILEYYLNTINLGQNILGVQAAAKYYFDKDVSSLTLSECAVLAGIVKNPTANNPVTHPKRNRTQRTSVLTSMKEQGYITNEDYSLAVNDDVYDRIQAVAGNIPSNTTGFTSAVIDQVISDMKSKLGYTETQAYNALYGHGLTIYTTQDSSMQEICEKQIKTSHLMTKTKLQHSFVLMDSATGEVKALIGGRDDGTEQFSVNRATDLTRQPGSAFSLLASYLPALDTAGMTLATVQDDNEYTYPGTKQKVKNWYGDSYRGLSSIQSAISNASNVIAVKTMEQIGERTSYDYLLNLGFTSIVDQYTDNTGTSYTDIRFQTAEGSLTKGVSNLELTGAYASIANGGTYHRPLFYTKILDSDGNVLIDNTGNTDAGTRVMKESTAWLLTSVLRDEVKNGSESDVQLAQRNIDLAGKSGASDKTKDLWFIGYTPNLTAGIWCGFDDNKSISSKQTVSGYEKKAWRDIMKKILESYEDTEFERPNSITTAKICTKCGKLSIDGLCSHAIGGSCEKEEYFVTDTVPTESCDCHVRCRICKSSGYLAGDNCPESKIYTAVYLQKNELSADTESSKKAAKTDDSPLIIPSYLSQSVCKVHN
jgi:penicillin-binding protein 1A